MPCLNDPKLPETFGWRVTTVAQFKADADPTMVEGYGSRNLYTKVLLDNDANFIVWPPHSDHEDYIYVDRYEVVVRDQFREHAFSMFDVEWDDADTKAQSSQAEDEMFEGYRDGLKEDAVLPSDNRSASYRHGWLNGEADRTGKARGTAQQLRVAADEAIAADEAR